MSQYTNLPRDSDTIAVDIYRIHSQSLLIYVRSRLASQQEAEDIVVDVFLVALANDLFLRLKEQEQAAWLRRVAQRKIADYYRAILRAPNIDIADVIDTLESDSSPENETLRSETQSALRDAVACLSHEQQTILRLRFADGLRCKEIAAYLGIQEDAARKKLSRTLNQLRTLYTNDEGDR
jgi:RNA polymerase sigma factor (sigma-70 family)